MVNLTCEIENICKGNCKECKTKICSDANSNIYNMGTNCLDCTEELCNSCFKKNGFKRRGGSRVC